MWHLLLGGPSLHSTSCLLLLCAILHLIILLLESPCSLVLLHLMAYCWLVRSLQSYIQQLGCTVYVPLQIFTCFTRIGFMCLNSQHVTFRRKDLQYALSLSFCISILSSSFILLSKVLHQNLILSCSVLPGSCYIYTALISTRHLFIHLLLQNWNFICSW